jgi:hypothetical protein
MEVEVSRQPPPQEHSQGQAQRTALFRNSSSSQLIYPAISENLDRISCNIFRFSYPISLFPSNMKVHLLVLNILSLFNAFVKSASFHLDVSHNGDAMIDVDLDPNSVPKSHINTPFIDQPKRSSQASAPIADSYLVDLDSHQHKGFLSVFQSVASKI